MQNEIVILKVNKFSSVALVTVKYRKADGTVDFASGSTEAEAMANIGKVVEVKSYDFAPLPKRSKSGTYFTNNRGVAVEIWKKSERKLKKVLDRKQPLPYLNNMTNDFANINAESNLKDMIALTIEEIAEANAWFDARNEATVAKMESDEIPMSF